MILEKEYFKAQNAVFDNVDLGLSCYDKIVYLYLCRCSNQGADAIPGYTGIAKRCGMARGTAINAIKRLESKEFITLTRRFNSNGHNKSNLYQVNPLPSKTETPGVVSHRHQPSATVKPPLVQQEYYPSIYGIPYKEPLINNHTINKHFIKKDEGTSVKEDTSLRAEAEKDEVSHQGDTHLMEEGTYPSEKPQATRGLASLADKGSKKNPIHPVANTPLPFEGYTSTHGDRIEAFLQFHGPAPIKAISQATGIDRNSVNTTLHIAKGNRFQHLPEKRAWSLAEKDSTPIKADKSTDDRPESHYRASEATSGDDRCSECGTEGTDTNPIQFTAEGIPVCVSCRSKPVKPVIVPRYHHQDKVEKGESKNDKGKIKTSGTGTL